MHIETQFSVFLINKPGVLAQTLNELAKEKINIIAMTMMDSVEHGVLRLVTASSTKTRKVLQQLDSSVNESEVLCVNLSNNSGALAEVASKLSKAHINISYAYCTAGARGGRTTGVLKVADVKKAMKVLQKNTQKKTTKKNSSRRIDRASSGRRK
ncbi:MAG: ACT domain-containing protein [Sedimentisphaerales bacterium]|nr:ACT domain-containing protein [Sedimentisphaerales bacterium]